MLFFQELWAPIIASACTVCVLAILLRRALHEPEWRQLPQHEAVKQALRLVPPTPGLYMLPHTIGQDLGRADMRASLEQGPVAYITIAPNGVPSSSGRLVVSFFAYLAVSTVVAYATWHGFSTLNSGIRHMPLGIPFAHVMRVVFAITGLAYAGAAVHESVWFGRPWASFLRTLVDAALYALATAVIFAWFWPD